MGHSRGRQDENTAGKDFATFTPFFQRAVCRRGIRTVPRRLPSEQALEKYLGETEWSQENWRTKLSLA